MSFAISACLGTNHIGRATAFYDTVLATLGLKRTLTLDHEAGWGEPDAKRRVLYVVTPYDGRPATWGNGTQISFPAPDEATVRAFHAAAIGAGGMDEGAPGPRDYRPGYYGAYVRDPDGNKLHVFFVPG